MIDGQHVLVVDGLTETQEVLQTVLAAQGLKVDRIGHAIPTAGETQDPLPDILVIDTDFLPIEAEAPARWQGIPRVIIGAAQITPTPENPEDGQQRRLSKPFLFPDLIQAVEQLLNPERQN